MSIEFKNNSLVVKKALEAAGRAWLHESAGEMLAQVQRNTKVDTGQTKESWQYKVNEATGEAVIGSNYENAIWEEFGTGIYAEKGDGRKTAWYYYSEKLGKYVKTVGKRPRRAFHKAYTSTKPKIVRRAAAVFGEGMK